MSEVEKMVTPGAAYASQDGDSTMAFAPLTGGLSVMCSSGDPLLQLSEEELIAFLSNRYTLTLVAKSQPQPERWVVEIEDCLRPWEKTDPLGPFDTVEDAFLAATDWSGVKCEEAGGTFITESYPGLCRITVKSRLGQLLHYRLTWSKEGDQ